ncbi:MAG: multiheme c-type cytochrome, partial [Limisphaerales bacterium]
PSRSIGEGIEASVIAWSNNAPEVTTYGLSGKTETFTPLRVIGNDPLRQFLVDFPNGRVQTLELAYDPHSNQWFNVFGNERRKPGEWGHWTGRGMNWNSMCASCHNTRLLRNYDEAGDAYHTTMAEMSVGCEACHGPMKAHDDWQNQFGKSGREDPTLKKFTHAQTLDTCGACHARRTELTADFKPGGHFLDSYDLVVVDATDRYYADGQVRAEDYEYASFLGSRMHLRGVACTDCHNPHTMKTLLPGNWLCLRCHNGSYTNAPVIDPIAHSHHKVFGFTNLVSRAETNGQAISVAVNTDLTSYRPREIAEQGGECVNCHMPQTVYMQRHWRHDHGFTIPDPLLTKEFGIPNACNRCHKDKTIEWALDACEQWYGPKMDRPSRLRAQIIARAQAGDPGAREPLVGLLDREDSPYWRAAELGFLGRWSARPEIVSLLVTNLGDTNALVRTSAAAALEPALTASYAGVAEALEKSLHDPVRSVRIAAVGSLGDKVAPDSAAGLEFQRYLDANADQPTGQAQKAIACSMHNDLVSA